VLVRFGSPPSSGAAHLSTSLIVTLALLGVGLVVAVVAPRLAERWLRTHGLDRVAARLEEQLGSPVEITVPEVELWRALVLERRLSHVRLTADDVPIKDGRARLRLVEAELLELVFVGQRHRPRVEATAGTFKAILDEDELDNLLELPPLLERVRLQSDGLRVETVAGLPFPAEVQVRDGQLVVVPRSPQLLRMLPQPQMVLGLPELPLGARITRLQLADGHVEASGPLDPEQLAT
jgi:hypothetical protein